MRSHKLPLLARFAPALLLLAAAPAHGALIRYDFGGVVTGSPTGAYAVGDRFTGSLIYDDAVPLHDTSTNTAGTSFGYYDSGTHRSENSAADGTGLDIRVGGASIIAPSTGLTGWYSSSRPTEGPFIEHYGFSSYPISSSPGQPGAVVSFTSVGSMAFPGGRLPSSLGLGDLTFASVTVESVAGSNSLIYPAVLFGTIDTLTATPVPEPAWTVAALMGLALAAARFRRGGS